jgi:glycosyltransferase involved in cell wall biosynthesis
VTNAPVVSICVPAYDEPQLLRRAIASTLAQSFDDFELLIDDDSPSTAVESMRDVLTSDPRVTYSRNQPPLGPAENWNKAMSRARGKYVKFLHHDDWFSRPDSLHMFVEAAEASAAGFVFAASNAISPSGEIVSENRPAPDVRRRLARRPNVLLSTGNIIGGPSATMFRRDATVIFDPRLRWLVDVDFYVTYLGRNPGFEYVEQVLISNTTGADHQLTAESFGKLPVEVREWDYVYRKHSPKAVLPRLLKVQQLGRRYGLGSSSGIDLADLPMSTRAAVRAGALESRVLRGLRFHQGGNE